MPSRDAGWSRFCAPREDLRPREDQSEAGSGLADLRVISTPSQDSAPAPEEVHSSSTVSLASTYRLPMSVAAPGAGGDGLAPGAAAIIGLPPHSMAGARAPGTRTTTTRVVHEVLATCSPRRAVTDGVAMTSPSSL